jgi:hypothetical protein
MNVLHRSPAPNLDRDVVIELIGDLLKGIAIEFQKRQQMLIEANGFIVVAVKQSFAMQSGLVDQTRQMHIAAEFLIGTARMQPCH